MCKSMLAFVSSTSFLSVFCGCSKVPEKSQETVPAATAPGPTKTGATFGKLAVTPRSGTATRQVFTVTLERVPGAPSPALIGLLIAGASGSGNDACYVFHQLDTKRGAVLVNDSGEGSKPIGDGASISNKQCDLLKDQTTFATTDTTVTAQFNLRFHAGFKGSRKVYAIAQDANGAGNGLQPGGDFVVP